MAAFFMEYGTSEQPSYDNVSYNAHLFVGELIFLCTTINTFFIAVVVVDHFDHFGGRHNHIRLLSRKAKQQYYGFLQRHDSTGKRQNELFH